MGYTGRWAVGVESVYDTEPRRHGCAAIVSLLEHSASMIRPSLKAIDQYALWQMGTGPVSLVWPVSCTFRPQAKSTSCTLLRRVYRRPLALNLTKIQD